MHGREEAQERVAKMAQEQQEESLCLLDEIVHMAIEAIATAL
jgi:hypothetical protein